MAKLSRSEMELNLRSLLTALPNSTDVLTTLSDIRAAISFVSPAVLRDLVPSLSFNRLFDFLRTDDSKQIHLSCQVLEYLLTAVDSAALLPSFHAELLLGLTHGATDVKNLCLNQITRIADSTPQQVALHVDIVAAVTQLIADASLETAQKACRVCILLARSVDGLDVMLKSNRVFPELMTIVGKDDVVRYRVYEMIVEISSESVESLMYAVDCGLLPHLIAELSKEDDVLLRLNCLELLATLASSQHGLAYIDREGVLTKLEHILNDIEEDPFGSLILPGVIKFFGSVCCVQPIEMPARFRPFLLSLFSMIEDGDIGNTTAIAVETIGLVGRSTDGKLALEKFGDAMHMTCQRLGKFLVNAPSDLRVRSLESVRQLIYLPVADQTTELLALTEDWFAHLSPSDNQLGAILTIAKQPFADLHLSALGLLCSISLVAWGQRRLHAHPGFDEYLLDRSTESTKEGLEGKFQIVHTLLESPTALDVFGGNYVGRLRVYDSEGAFYVRRVTQVAYENAE